MATLRINVRKAAATVAAVCMAAVLLGGCAGGQFNHPGPPHPGAANPWSMGGFSDPGPNYPPTGH